MGTAATNMPSFETPRTSNKYFRGLVGTSLQKVKSKITNHSFTKKNTMTKREQRKNNLFNQRKNYILDQVYFETKKKKMHQT